jgi:putative SOS response-associated peptidase YedK
MLRWGLFPYWAEPPANLLKPYPAVEMESRAVSREVNSPAKDEPGLIEPIVVGSASAE